MRKILANKGFTFAELLIVILIISILAAGILVIFDPVAQLKRENDVQRKSDLSQIQKAIEQYYQDIGAYPQSTIDYKIKALGGENAVDWGNSWLPYMGTLPSDPKFPRRYIYVSSGQAYYLYASLERGASEAGACNKGAVCGNVPKGASCGKNAICNYGVSSPNMSP